MTSSFPTARVGTSIFSSSLLLGILLIAANLRAPITSLGPVLDQVQQYFALSAAAAGFLNAVPLLMFAAASPLAPWLTRRLGLEQALFGGLCLIAIGCLVRSSGTSTGLWVGTLLIGGGIAIANVLIVPLVKRDFPSHTALCVGLYAATMALMAALASGLSAPLSSLTGYTWKISLGVWFLLALVALVCWLPHLSNARGRTEVQAPSAAKSVWRSGIAWQVSMFMALQTAIFYTLIDWYPAMANSIGIGASESGLHLFAYQAVAVVANLSTSVAIKRLKDQRLLGFVCSLAITVGIAGLVWAPSLSLVWLLVAGAGQGMSMVTCLTLFGLRVRDHHQASSLSAMAQCVGYGLGSAGPFLAGWLHNIFGTWQVSLLMLLAAASLQIFFAVMAGRNRFVD
ncbi:MULTISPECIES: MFS transporter [unclassified Pseudomonas]|uniref:CynX/NimT family MFS transporter n=1 Tax=unclassified Pseudomonas TaxID=196821 RepID=UPI000C88838F|nr:MULTISPECIES: MFS transporter [unclassified Pseudomonas]PMZ73224.1 MFS transporter [Pseudomonas sp. GW247-3R2A]PMY73354.1 MFS transporter [Pseudomonas sp. MPR-R3A]PMY98034.1 MFS transporter [Pseudomonas sp. FW305-124]PNA92622.1 MFS transporter [Pseudomonas sp. FW300-E2]PNB03174.1 MFS transporter [Pseudomonas sp. MPR-AND1B]